MAFFTENIAIIMAGFIAIATYFLMNWAKVPLKMITKLIPFCKNKRISTIVNASAGLSESCVISSLLLSIINLVGGLSIDMAWAVAAGCAANFAYLFIENIGKAKAGTLTEEDQAKIAAALDETVNAVEQAKQPEQGEQTDGTFKLG